MNERHISGIVRAASVTGNALRRAPVSGAVQVTGNTIRELVFGPRSRFPEQGQPGVLYIDTDSSVIYYWSNRYTTLSTQIDDVSETYDSTWSSLKIADEFRNDQDQLDRIGNIESVSNYEIQSILDS